MRNRCAVLLRVSMVLPLALAAIGCNPDSQVDRAHEAVRIEKPMEQERRITLPVLELEPDGEFLIARFRVGPLPDGARVVVYSEQGEILGAITPFASANRESEQSYDVAVPRYLAEAGDVTLLLRLLHLQSAPPRAPTNEEILGVEFVPPRR